MPNSNKRLESESDTSDAALDAERATWRILVVDDERDVHEVTHLALKRRTWRRRTFELVSCYSAREARELLKAGPPNRFQVALIDVVMETPTAGLDLCRELRNEYPPSLRIILRTGQPGVAPEERVINEYDIDAYMAKAEVTPERLYATVRSCLRGSQDIDTLLAFSRQLRNFTSALQSISTDEDLEIFMNEGLRFLELKHQVSVHFVKNVDGVADGPQRFVEPVRRAHEVGHPLGVLQPGAPVGLPEHDLLLFAVRVEGSDQTVRGGFVIGHLQAGYMVHGLQSDLTLFMQNWTIAHGAMLLQQRVAREKMLNERMYVDRIESIATMVTGVAHEINTPLGVANTANGIILSLAKEIAHTPPGPQYDELLADLTESTELLRKNLDRASKLVRSFKQLSSSQLSDDRGQCDLATVIDDCIHAMSVDTKRRQFRITRSWKDGETFPWVGFPGHLSQVVVNLMQNTLRYAYKPDESGAIDLAISVVGDGYEIRFTDHGAGVDPAIFPRMFEPFVTSGRGQGGTGLGLAITHNIVTNLLSGTITATSEIGKGTTFVLRIPRVVPVSGEDAAAEDKS